MDAITMIKERRSVRKFKNKKVDRETMKEIVSVSRWAPSWANTQIARYTLVDDEATIKKLATDGVKGFVYNIKTLENAKGVAVLSFVKGSNMVIITPLTHTSGKLLTQVLHVRLFVLQHMKRVLERALWALLMKIQYPK